MKQNPIKMVTVRYENGEEDTVPFSSDSPFGLAAWRAKEGEEVQWIAPGQRIMRATIVKWSEEPERKAAA